MNRTEKILNSLNGMQKATALPFFYTRLSGKMQTAVLEKQFFILRPAFLTVTLLVILMANVATLARFSKSAKQPTNNATIGTFANEYDLTINSIYQ